MAPRCFSDLVGREISRATQPNHAFWIRWRASRCYTPANQSCDQRDMRQRDQRDVSPKTRRWRSDISKAALSPFIRLCFGGDADLRNLRAAFNASINADQFLHRQIAIGSNHNGDIWIGLFQFHQPRRERFQVDYLIVKPDRLTAIDRDNLHLRRDLIGGFVAPLDGITRFMLLSSSGVVIMKMMSNTNARSSSGVILISLSVERFWRWE